MHLQPRGWSLCSGAAMQSGWGSLQGRDLVNSSGPPPDAGDNRGPKRGRAGHRLIAVAAAPVIDFPRSRHARTQRYRGAKSRQCRHGNLERSMLLTGQSATAYSHRDRPGRRPRDREVYVRATSCVIICLDCCLVSAPSSARSDVVLRPIPRHLVSRSRCSPSVRRGNPNQAPTPRASSPISRYQSPPRSAAISNRSNKCAVPTAACATSRPAIR